MLNAVVHSWVICRVYCSQTLKLPVRSIVHKQLNLSCFGKASFDISKRLLRYYRSEMQRAVLPPLPLLVKGQGGQLPPPRSGTTEYKEFNAPFCIPELKDSLKTSSNTAVGADNISTEMLKHMPEHC